ncbi:SufD family Fe-S cluster assembly protein [bacterium]|nr:SufD family Fe-S cluster assembly protein [bacterium]
MEKTDYQFDSEPHAYVENLAEIPAEDAREFLNVGIDTEEKNRSATFILKDLSVVHCKTRQEGVEVLTISAALKKYDGLKEYMWQGLSPDKDEFTKLAQDKPSGGFFIRCAAGVKTLFPVQTCLHLSKEGMTQNVHNILIAEEQSNIHVIAGCSTSPHLDRGQHVGVSEFYVKKGATLTYTMIHDWGSNIVVRPRTVTYVEEGGTFVSNYISLKPVGSLQTNPRTYLNGKGAVARFNSILVAAEGTFLDTGSEVILNAEDTRAEIISRAITTGGTVIARGKITGKYAGVRGHLECKGLILKEGLLHAIPELEALVPGVEMSHEAAVGKIDQREIEYLMARGLDEETAVSTIVRGFLNVEIEGLPQSLADKIEQAISETQHDMI